MRRHSVSGNFLRKLKVELCKKNDEQLKLCLGSRWVWSTRRWKWLEDIKNWHTTFLHPKGQFWSLKLPFWVLTIDYVEKCSQNSVKMQSKYSQNSVKMQSKYSQNPPKIQSKFSQILNNFSFSHSCATTYNLCQVYQFVSRN